MEIENAYPITNGPCTLDWEHVLNRGIANGFSSKRKCSFVESDNDRSSWELNRSAPQESRSGSFVSIRPFKGVYSSECWKMNGTTLYQPISFSLLVNMRKYDQISFEEGAYFIGDKSGGCVQKEQGHVIHCWRFDKNEKKLFVALSFLFTNNEAFQEVVSALGNI